jgi:hypothetical protein
MPAWARAAVDVLGEHHPDPVDETPTGRLIYRYRYEIGVVLVPRQSAKTTTALDIALGRCLAAPAAAPFLAAYAAQTGHVTTERMGDRFTEVGASPLLRDRLKPRLSQGTERLTVISSRSYIKAFPPKAGALRSSALDLVIVDEGQEHDMEPLGRLLDHTIHGTFTTRPRRQFLILGTAPDRPGTYLERYATLARAGAPGVALIDYGATPDEDPADPATWHRRHPGLAAGLTDEAFLRTQYELDPAGFAREHLNVWPAEGAASGAAIPASAWHAAALPDDEAHLLDTARPRPDGLALAVAVDGERAALCAAYRLDEHRVLVKVHHADAGTAWTLTAARDASRRFGLPVTVDAFGPAGPVVDELKRAGTWLDVVTTGAYTTACVGFLADVIADPPRLVHLAQPVLTTAALTAGRRVLDRGTWAWSRRAGDVTALEAASLAAHAARNAAPAPRVR